MQEQNKSDSCGRPKINTYSAIFLEVLHEKSQVVLRSRGQVRDSVFEELCADENRSRKELPIDEVLYSVARDCRVVERLRSLSPALLSLHERKAITQQKGEEIRGRNKVWFCFLMLF